MINLKSTIDRVAQIVTGRHEVLMMYDESKITLAML